MLAAEGLIGLLLCQAVFLTNRAVRTGIVHTLDVDLLVVHCGTIPQ